MFIATGSKRETGIWAPGKSTPVFGSTGIWAVDEPEKLPTRSAADGGREVLENVSTICLNCSKETKKNVLLWRTGPPKLAPYWL